VFEHLEEQVGVHGRDVNARPKTGKNMVLRLDTAGNNL